MNYNSDLVYIIKVMYQLADMQTRRFITALDGFAEFVLSTLPFDKLETLSSDPIESSLYLIGNLTKIDDEQCSYLCQ